MELTLKSEDQEVKINVVDATVQQVIDAIESANLTVDHVGSRPNDRG